MEQKKQEQSEKDRCRYAKKKAEANRQRMTRNSLTPVTPRECCASCSEGKKPQQMTPEGYRDHRNSQHRRSRDNQSSQIKTSAQMMRRRLYAENKVKEREAEMEATAAANSKGERLNQSCYQRNYQYKVKAKQLGITPGQFGRNVLNLTNSSDPEVRAAVSAIAPSHPTWYMYQVQPTFNAEEELGFEDLDKLEYGPYCDEEFSKPLHDRVVLFYLSDEVSRMLPHARYSTKHGAARVMLMTLKNAHQEFLTKFLDESIGLTLFQSLRPSNVRLMGSVSIETCFCVYCTNKWLKIRVINRLLGSSGQIPPGTKMLDILCCAPPKDERWPSYDCISGKCDRCKHRMRVFDIFCQDIMDNDSLTWERVGKNGDGRLEPLLRPGSIRDLLKELEEDFNHPTKGTSFAEHLFTACWQFHQY